MKLAPNAAAQAAISETERVRGAAFAETLSLRVLSRAWQMLLKGIAEVAEAPRPLTAAEMVLVRLCHAADLPTPDEAIRVLDGSGRARPMPAAACAGAARPRLVHGCAGARAGARRRALNRRRRPRAAAEASLSSARFDDVIARARSGARHLLVLRARASCAARALRAGADRDRADGGRRQPTCRSGLAQVLQGWTGGAGWSPSAGAAPQRDGARDTRAKPRGAAGRGARRSAGASACWSAFPARRSSACATACAAVAETVTRTLELTARRGGAGED